jgi:LacI family transcriptional regulator, galactose operon repressor
MPPKGKIGLREIAKAAHVSMATASRVLNGKGRVDAEMRNVVLAEAKKLGIDPSQRYKSRTLAFLLSNRAMLHAFHSRILSGAEEHCRMRGWEVVFLSYQYSRHTPWNELQLPQVVGRRDLIRGLILAGTNSANLLELLRNKEIMFSVLGNNVIGDHALAEKCDVVYADDIQGGRDATEQLLRLGHQRIWFVGNSRLPWFSRLLEGYRRAMRESGFEARASDIDSEDDTECGYLGTKSLLAHDKEATAIVAGNDQVAGGVYKALREKELSIPEDISVVGCDDTVGMWLYPALSTIREYPEHLGRSLAEAVLKRIEDPDQAPQHITVPTEFIRRDSCGPPPELLRNELASGSIRAGV